MQKSTEVTKVAFADRFKKIRENFLTSVRKHKWLWLYFTIIGIVFLLTRLVQITVLPKGMHIDEMSMGYNTWTLTEFGTDRYGVSYPVYFNNAGSGQSSLYVYLAVLVSKIFGYSLLSLRIVSVFFGALLLIFGTKAAYEMFGIRCAVITAAVIDIMPIFLMSERWAFDCNAMLPMMAMFFYFFVMLLKTGKKRYAAASGITFGLTFYTYIIAVIMLPVFAVLAVLYAFFAKKLTIKNIGLMFLCAIVVSIPILLYLFVIVGVLPEFSIGAISFTNASANRANEIFWQGLSFKDVLNNLYAITSYDKYEFLANEKHGVFYQNMLHFFEWDFSVSQVLLTCAFFTLIGCAVYTLVKKKEFSLELLVLVYIIAVLFPMFLMGPLVIYRFNAVYYPLALILAFMLAKLWEHKRRVLCILVAVLYAYNFVSYTYYLFSGNFAEDNKSLAYFDDELIEICETLEDDVYKDAQIYVDDTAVFNAGLIVLYGLRVEPEEVQNVVVNLDTRIMSYGNIHVGIPEVIDADQKSVYIIRDINSETTYYTNNVEQLEMYEKIIVNNKARQLLTSLNVPYEVKNNYYIFSVPGTGDNAEAVNTPDSPVE